MGTFQVPIEIGDPKGVSWETTEALVDTGSTYTWIPRELLERLEVHAQFEHEFETADERVVRRDMVQTRARLDSQERITIVVFGNQGDSALLGTYTLEGFALAPDPVNQRLLRIRGLAM